MSFKEINNLRKAGDLDEALKMANEALESEPDNIWNKRAAAWVHYEYLKKNSQPKSYETFKKHLQSIKDLKLPNDENMVFDNSAWQIGSIVFGLLKQDPKDQMKISELFNIIKDFSFSKPSEAYTFIYKAFHKGYQNWMLYLNFANWWDFENFRPDDYLKQEYNGRKIMSIAEQAYIAYSKILLEGDPFAVKGGVDKDKIRTFIPKLNQLIEKHPEFQYPPYFKAKLLLALGDEENTLSSFLPFAKQKRNSFWVWELMSQIFLDDKEIQFACYCKALSLNTPEEYLVKIRQTFAGMLMEKKMYREAKTEIQRLISTREKQQWRLPNQIIQWTEQDWYKSATREKGNKDLYSKHLNKAEEILFQDIPEEVIAVEFVNENKDILNFVKDKEKFGFFKYSGHLDSPKVGALLKVRFHGDGQDGFYKILSARKAESHLNSEAVRDYEGTLKVIPPENFGFVDNCFVPPKLIAENKVQNGETVNGKAVLSFNKKKNEWGWKVITV